ncbi:hypothetical protein WKI72_14440 [Candidatus Erwinia dacicola]
MLDNAAADNTAEHNTTFNLRIVSLKMTSSGSERLQNAGHLSQGNFC